MPRNPLPLARWLVRWELGRIRTSIERLRRREGTLSFHAERKGPFARQASALAAALGCALTDHLSPAADALERELANEDLPSVADDPEDEGEEGEPK